MFTIKLKTGDGYRTVIREAESFTILHGADPSGPDVKEDEATAGIVAEITLHHIREDCRFDIGELKWPAKRLDFWPPVFQVAYIENAAGKTVEIIGNRGPSASLKATA